MLQVQRHPDLFKKFYWITTTFGTLMKIESIIKMKREVRKTANKEWKDGESHGSKMKKKGAHIKKRTTQRFSRG